MRESNERMLSNYAKHEYDYVRVLGEDEVVEVVRLTCMEQGITLTDQINAPTIRIEGIKLELQLPKAAQDPAVLVNDEIRGEHG